MNMRKHKWLTVLVLLVTVGVHAQNWQKAGDCTSFAANGNTVVFNTAGKAKLSVKFSSGSVVKIWYDPKGAFKRNNESFAVINENLEPLSEIRVEEQAQSYEVFTGKLRVRVNKYPLQVQVFDKYQKLLLGDYKDLGHVSEGNATAAFKTLRSDEHFLGLGEKSGPLDRRGRSYRMWNSDKPCYGVNEDPLYKSIPFFMSSYRYGIFFDNTYKTQFKFGTASDEYYSFEAPNGEMVYYFIHGNDYKQIIEQYTQLTGKPILPPDWAFGFSQCRGLYTNEKLARSVAAEFRKRKIPCDIIYQDIGWVDGLQDFNWHKDKYTDPKGMVSYLDSMGFKMILSQDPVISQATQRQWREADSLHYFAVDSSTGKSYDMPWPWGGNCGVVDFTHPAVADWWGAQQQKPLNDGVRGFWTDMGEPAWSNEDATERLRMKHYLGMHDEIHNVYGFSWDKVVKEQFEKRNPNKRVFQMTRAAYAGLQRYTFGWSGDSGNGDNVLDGWNRLANQVPIGISAGMGVLPFWACDISGYCGDVKDYPAMAELYTRWMQFGVFNPLSRAHHEGDNAVEPWLFGKEAEDICRKAIELKYRLFPYIYTYAREAHEKGLPLMRALILEYPEDENAFKVDDEFMFGHELLVAPVLKKGAVSRNVYLPEGEWIDFNDGKTVYNGGQVINYPAPLAVTPIFVRKGSIIPMMPVMQYIGQEKNHPVYAEIFPHDNREEATFTLYEDDGNSLGYQKDEYGTVQFTCKKEGAGYSVSVVTDTKNGFVQNSHRNIVLNLHLNRKPSAVATGKVTAKVLTAAALETAIGKEITTTAWSWNEKTKVCSIKLPAGGAPLQVTIKSPATAK
ncbi:putative alpha-glucosidase [Flavihumibacter petaseus NBRC 106054]|uniref:Putative alpha-glucosidase n=2 Tax=Flavihumibacter TaxID=1004301 RepID=A0A0E9N6L4_9BACT|nr:putative alpha-glucosidase [Flavihumibacter petaseus NBRC 106054]